MQWSKIWSFLIADIYHFSLSFIHLLNETLASWHNWLLSSWSSLINWKGPVLSPRPPNCSKDSWKLLPLLISISWKSLVTEWVVVMHPVSCTSTHHDVTDLVNHGMCKNTKTWMEHKLIYRWCCCLHNFNQPFHKNNSSSSSSKRFLTPASYGTFWEVIIL